MIYGIYFSPTDNSKKYVESMCKTISKDYKIFDVTSKEISQTFTNQDFVIIGAPVYGGRIPNVSKQRFSLFKANNTPCLLVATYGNRHYDDALIEMKELFESNSFIVHGACALIGRHTYGSIAVDRPNIDDLSEASQYALSIYNRQLPLIQTLPGIHHEDEIVNKGRFYPNTTSKCIHCKICVQNCPVGAILDDCTTITDSCISCFRCLKKCPMNAKIMDDEGYINFANMFSEKLKVRRENEYFK